MTLGPKLFSFFFIGCSLVFSSVQGDEPETIDYLIAQTEKQLQTQKRLKEQIALFSSHKKQFINDDQTKAQAARMIKTANHILEIITAHHLHHLFSSEDLEELSFFASMAAKNSPKRP
jgi:hypothetical protein